VTSRRWNGWGDEGVKLELPATAHRYLEERLGKAQAPPDARIDEATSRVPPSRLTSHPLVHTDSLVRLRHARGQSLPDWLALRFGRIDTVPDGVAFPESSQDVRDLLAFARSCSAAVIPYGGGTSVAGHITPEPGDTPTLTVSLARMRALTHLDEQSRLATFEAGVTGPDLETQLRAHGYTLGHFPQSFEYSTLGGWIVTRSSGQQSLRYGRIEALFAGGKVETPAGTLRIPTFPASAAGIDLREMILGSEGRAGIVTDATVRVTDVPRHESFEAIFFPSWERARDCVTALAHAGVPLSMIRLANPLETFTTLQLAGASAAVVWLERYLALRGARNEKCLLLAGVTGSGRDAAHASRALRSIARGYGGVYAGAALGERWRRNRYRGVYLRNALWESGYAVDTVETAVDWPRVDAMMQAMEGAARGALGDEPVHAYTHLSHVYPEGSSVYSTFVFRIAPDYETNLARWTRLKRAVSEAIVANGGTITHQHGVGVDHKPYLAAEKGALGLDAMRALFARFDPDGTMNPGKLC
jgi:alkyldihydroxyacetonephosphate synthase